MSLSMRGFVGILALLLLCVGMVAPVAADHDPPHEDPDEVGDAGDLSALEQWYIDHMSNSHVECEATLELEGESLVGDDAICEQLGKDYSSLLERFGDLEGTTRPPDDQLSGVFNGTRNDHREFAKTVVAFEETYEEYQTAREAGDDERARERLRDLRSQADRINDSGTRLEDGLRELDDETEFDLNTTADGINETRLEALENVEAAEDLEFLETDLTVAVDGSASIVDPATVSGRVVDENGTAVTTGDVVIRDGIQSYTAAVNETGHVRLAYRPALAPVGEQQLSVAYRPPATSRYLPSETTEPIALQAAPSTTAVQDVPRLSGFSGQVAFDGTVAVGDQRVGSVPVVVTVGDQQLTTVRTADDGTFRVNTTLPASVPDGNQSLTVRASNDSLTVAPSTVTSNVTILETATELSMTVSGTDSNVLVSGRLTTGDGRPASEQLVTVRADGTTYTAVTDGEGNYTVDIPRPEEGGNLTFVAVYEDPDTNLEPARVERTVNLSTLAPPELGLEWLTLLVFESPPLGLLFVVTVLAMFVVGLLGLEYVTGWPTSGWAYLVHLSRRITNRLPIGGTSREPTPVPVDAEPNGGATALELTSAADTDATEGAPPSGPLAALRAARKSLDTAPDAAVEAGYGVVYAALTGDTPERGDDSEPDTIPTHWELYEGLHDELDADRTAALRSVTEAFEAAAFAPSSVGTDRAAAALDAAERCLDVDGDAGEDTPGGNAGTSTD